MELEKEFIDKKTGISYTLQGDYYIPNISALEDTDFIIGKYGKAHLKYIEEHKKSLYTSLLYGGKINAYLHEIDEKSNELLESIINKLSKQEEVTENLKANHQLEWVARMNNIKSRAEEIVYNEYVYC